MAKERSYDYFWNSNSDRYYDADSMGDWLRPFYSNGVFNGQMQVTANDNMSVTIAAGYGYINGKHRHFLTPTTLDLETASGTLDRIDNVILRRNDTERRIYLLIETGGKAKTPVAPTLTREGAIYDLKLAEIYIAAGTVKITQAEITDTRMNSDVCGWVAATVKQIDFTQIQAQFEAYFTQYKKNISAQFQNFVQDVDNYNEQAETALILMKQTFEDYANQQEEINTQWFELEKENFQQWRQEQEAAVNNWYETVKGILSEDVALNLKAELDAHTEDKNNPHAMNKNQLGLDQVDNTSDANKPVSTAQQAALDSYYQQSTGYTDQKIADLINGAPSTLDTLKEIADALENNETVVETLNDAIGTKANQTEVESMLNAINQRFGGLSFAKCTQSQYEALGSGRPSNTLYIVVG